MKVRIDELVEALEMQFDEYPSFVDLDTGKVETISRDTLRAVEESDEDGDPEEEDDEWQTAKRILFTGNFRKLPTPFEVHEWSIMEEFSESVESTRIREDLLDAISGKGAFRYFKDTIRRYGIERDWFAFRAAALRQIAIDWCEEHQLEWE
jgi:hypothetical protein